MSAAVVEALRKAVKIDAGRCLVCDRDECRVNSTCAERDAAWGAFDRAKSQTDGYAPEHEKLRDAALASSKAATKAHDDCEAHRVNWRVRALMAEARIAAALVVYEEASRCEKHGSTRLCSKCVQEFVGLK